MVEFLGLLAVFLAYPFLRIVFRWTYKFKSKVFRHAGVFAADPLLTAGLVAISIACVVNKIISHQSVYYSCDPHMLKILTVIFYGWLLLFPFALGWLLWRSDNRQFNWELLKKQKIQQVAINIAVCILVPALHLMLLFATQVCCVDVICDLRR